MDKAMSSLGGVYCQRQGSMRKIPRELRRHRICEPVPTREFAMDEEVDVRGLR